MDSETAPSLVPERLKALKARGRSALTIDLGRILDPLAGACAMGDSLALLRRG